MIQLKTNEIRSTSLKLTTFDIIRVYFSLSVPFFVKHKRKSFIGLECGLVYIIYLALCILSAFTRSPLIEHARKILSLLAQGTRQVQK